MRYHLQRLRDGFRQTEEGLVELESVVFDLREVEQVHHQVLHHLRVRKQDSHQSQFLGKFDFKGVSRFVLLDNVEQYCSNLVQVLFKLF